MSKDFEYFTEFLADPSAYPFDEFHRLVKEWGRYIIAHKDEFNYLEDDEWKEIRERVLDAIYATEDQMDAVEAEWDEIGAMLETAMELSVKEKIGLYERQLQFMKDYKYYFNFKEEDIEELEFKFAQFAESARKVELLDMEVLYRKLDYEKSIAELDDYINDNYERTGSLPKVTIHKSKKKHRGN